MSKTPKTDGMEVLFMSLVTGDSNFAVEDQERQGQSDFVNSTDLPTDMRRGTREILEGQGVVFGDAYEDDPIFCPVQLPEGWSKRKTDHSTWSELVDGNGNVVANIFYKAAFYDRNAFIRAKEQ
jgi:hypothetical protein